MSKIKLEGNASGTGTLTIAAPNTNSDRTLTLPDGAGEIATVNGIKQLDQWRLNLTNTNLSTDGVISTNWERTDDATFAKIGGGLTESSGVFTFPETGIYEVRLHSYFSIASSDSAVLVDTYVSSDSGSNWDLVSRTGGGTGGTAVIQSGSSSTIINVTDASTYRFRFQTYGFATNTSLVGNTDDSRTHFTVIRLGDSA